MSNALTPRAWTRITLEILVLIAISQTFHTPRGTVTVHAATESELRQKIETKGKDIQALEGEIRSYESQLRTIGERAVTLESSLKRLDLTKRKLDTDVLVTQGKIDASELSIERANIHIGALEQKLAIQSSALRDTIRMIRDADNQSILEASLQYDSISDFWIEIELVSRVQQSLGIALNSVRALKSDVEAEKASEEGRVKVLASLQAELADRRKIIETTRREEKSLLTATRSTEANFKKTVAEKIALKEAFERELRAFESDLRVTLDPSLLPTRGSGVLSWPLDDIRITQRFGLTDFARSNTRLYGLAGHNGIDLAASVGTPVKASLDGSVEGVGDTDPVCPGASYGQWILLRHGNGLSTLYAHLSLTKVAEGATAHRGETIGYSGSTGYSTGPHLHFSVYATQGVAILERKSKVCKGTYRMPIADPRAYLDPLQYL